MDLIRKTGEYERALIEWYDLPDTDRTWARFKTHFTTAQQRLKRVRGSTMTNTPFHQANLAIRKDFESMRDDVVASLNAIAAAAETPPPTEPDPCSLPPPPPENDPILASLNAARSEAATLCQQMEALTAQVAAMSAQNGRENQRGGRGNGRGNGQGRGRGRGNFRQRRNISRYCWTHGACNHTGYNCENPAVGHRPEATFENKLGGSTYYCQVIDNNADTGDNG